MRQTLLEKLVCPKCKDVLATLDTSDEIIEGELECTGCNSRFPISNGIPRFVPMENYASSFGYQWNRFRKEQLDSYNGTTLSADRFWGETGWNKKELKGRWVVDAGCGAGRFLDAASSSEAEIIGVDISSAIDAAKESLEGRENVHFVQASIYELPFREGTIDYCYCIGVIQHTPDTRASLRAIAKIVKPGGKLAVTIYPRKAWTKLFSKYWFRPFTKRLRKETLLKLVEGVMPVAFPLTNVLFKLPLLGKLFMFTIPIANYVHETQLTREQRYAWAILDTFDMLSPYYDQPMTEREAVESLDGSGITVTRTTQNGLNLVGSKD
ncbi:MAG: methyltransferase domain-containing protein [Acidobacteria bacterium]|nr:methyltransferase domain-containing protein [Acidobacteriota bacterium]